MSTKRSASSAFGSLSVYTYQNPLAALFFPCTEGSNRSLVEPVLAAVFGPPCTSMFSLTSSSDGDFILADHAACGERLRLPQAAGAAGGSGEWRCLYIHEASFERGGAEISGALSLLCERLAAAEVAVLNMCSLARNFMVVRSSCEARAMQTLREAYEDGERPARPALPPPSGVRLRLLPPLQHGQQGGPAARLCRHRRDRVPALQDGRWRCRYNQWFQELGAQAVPCKLLHHHRAQLLRKLPRNSFPFRLTSHIILVYKLYVTLL